MHLIEFFAGVAAKRLRAVEADPKVSNQHEFDGINQFRRLLGNDDRKFDTTFMYVTDDDDPIVQSEWTRWYDSRRNQPKRSAEYRLYFPTTEVSQCYNEGDLLIVALRPDQSLLVIASPEGSTAGEQLLWLFGLESPNGTDIVKDAGEIDRDVDFVVRQVLDAVGIEASPPAVDADVVVERFGKKLPTTREFSCFAREMAGDCDPVANSDSVLMLWLDTEERYFRAFERVLVEDRLRQGFLLEGDAVDVDGFISYSLSVQNRRKSRAGHSLENHLEEVFGCSGIRFDRGAKTEGKSKPDFLFPGRAAYHDMTFNAAKLAMLGAKATCKDRWRQITAEADRIDGKHLLTLEPSISVNQTTEMRTRAVQLVLPAAIHDTYTSVQRDWLWTVSQFIEHVRELQV